MIEARAVSIGTAPARKFARLSGFAEDLSRAAEALAAAESMNTESEREQVLRSHLIDAGVIAYWRCFPTKKGKLSLESLVRIPVSLRDVHERSRLWRNHVVAHSDSAMRRTLAFMVLERNEDAINPSAPFALTVGLDVPNDEVRAFADMVAEVRTLVEQRQNILGDRLKRRLSSEALLGLWNRPEGVDTAVEEARLEWNPGKAPLEPFVTVSFSVPPPPVSSRVTPPRYP